MLKRCAVLFTAFAFVMGLLIIKILSIDINISEKTASSNNSRHLVISESRGYIYDRDMEPLVNETVYEKKTKLDNITNVSSLCSDRYSENQLCVHLLGHLDNSGKGVMGLEKCYDSILARYSGSIFVDYSVNAFGSVIGDNPIAEYDNYLSKGGIVLTIDKNIQRLTELAMDNNNLETGAAVVLDVSTSEILALCSRPDFNQNELEKAVEGENSPFLNRAISEYSVGSVFKPVVAAAALESGISSDMSYTCTGKIQIGDLIFNCHKKDGHGQLDMYNATAVSCNTYYINLSAQISVSSILSMAQNVGFGSKTELADNFYSDSGNVPSEDDINTSGARANLSFGQGTLLATPLQMAAVYAAIGNCGEYRAPTLMKAIVNEKGEEIEKVKLPASRRVMSKDTAKKIVEALTLTVKEGSGKNAMPRNCTAAGKTATAQSGWYLDGIEVTHSWFVGLFPAEKPKYAVAILKENGNSGSSDCAPVFKELAELITATEQ